MNRGTSRRRVGLVLVVTLLAAAFALSSVNGQGFRPPIGPRGPIGPRPPIGINGGIAGINGGVAGINGGIAGINGGIGGINGGMPGRGIIGGGPRFSFTCSNCGKEVGQGNSRLMDAPSSCPFCGVRFINGGMGRGATEPANPGMAPPGNPGMMPPTGIPPMGPPVDQGFPPNAGLPADNGIPPAAAPPDVQPAPPANPVVNPERAADPPAAATNTTTAATEKSGRGLMIGLIVGIILVGVGILIGGTWLMIVSLRSNGKSGGKRRRPRRYDDD